MAGAKAIELEDELAKTALAAARSCTSGSLRAQFKAIGRDNTIEKKRKEMKVR